MLIKEKGNINDANSVSVNEKKNSKDYGHNIKSILRRKKMFYDDSSNNSASISMSRNFVFIINLGSRRNTRSMLDNSRLRYSADEYQYGSKLSRNSKAGSSTNDINIRVTNFEPKDDKKQNRTTSPENSQLNYKYYGLLNKSNESSNFLVNRKNS